MESQPRHTDVVIVGAGLSGIAAAVELTTSHPERSFVVLDQRARLGGTWDLFRYPGIRSDSDMFTLGYAFKPWVAEKSIASGDAILDYLGEAVQEYGLEPYLRLQRKVRSASWSSEARRWTLEADGPDGPETYTCSFLYSAAGYYDHDAGYAPEFPGAERFTGTLVHPQEWPADLDCAGKHVAVIGSGATAITLVPALAEAGAHVTMVQRSPTYVAIDADIDEEAIRLRAAVGDSAAFEQIRLRNLNNQQERYQIARNDPDSIKTALFEAIDEIVGAEVREKHFTPAYQPWDQRLCLVPNGDLFHAINSGDAEVVTGRIETFTETGIRMESGEEIKADVIVTATGLNLVNLGKIALSCDGRPIDIADTFTYKGVGYSGVPNLIVAFGYLNSSWTLRLELVNRYWSALLSRMDELGATEVTPVLREDEADMPRLPWMEGVTAGYVLRHKDRFPAQGDHAPWINPQVHQATKELLAEVDDPALRFR